MTVNCCSPIGLTMKILTAIAAFTLVLFAGACSDSESSISTPESCAEKQAEYKANNPNSTLEKFYWANGSCATVVGVEG